jgi:hypothetical protein
MLQKFKIYYELAKPDTKHLHDAFMEAGTEKVFVSTCEHINFMKSS